MMGHCTGRDEISWGGGMAMGIQPSWLPAPEKRSYEEGDIVYSSVWHGKE